MQLPVIGLLATSLYGYVALCCDCCCAAWTCTCRDNAVTQGAAGAWAPQLSGLPQQERICDSRMYPYAAAISPVPTTGVTCNQPVSVSKLLAAHTTNTCDRQALKHIRVSSMHVN